MQNKSVSTINPSPPLCNVGERMNELSEEQLKLEIQKLKKEAERYKLLSEIRQQEINNRILTIKEFINNCSDNKVRSALKKLFYSEIKEYDLSAKYRNLLNENEQLKLEIQQLKNVSTN